MIRSSKTAKTTSPATSPKASPRRKVSVAPSAKTTGRKAAKAGDFAKASPAKPAANCAKAARGTTGSAAASDGDPDRRLTKRQQLLVLLEQSKPVALSEIASTFAWQSHSARAAVSGLRKAGYRIETTRTKTDGTAYTLVPGGSASNSAGSSADGSSSTNAAKEAAS